MISNYTINITRIPNYLQIYYKKGYNKYKNINYKELTITILNYLSIIRIRIIDLLITY